MRTLIFTFLLVAMTAIGAPQPTTYLNAWTTNRSVLPVFGDNNLSVSNRIAGPGGGTNWNFYGISPNTVARLKDATNIANAIVTNAIASSNGNYVLKYNGPSSGQIATNFTAEGATVHGGANVSGSSVFADDVIFDTSISAASALIQHLAVNDCFSMIFTNTGFGFIQNLRCASFTNVDSATFLGVTASKLAAFDANKVLTNSVYSDADIAALQAGVANTNAFVRIQSGTMNNITSTNGNFISPTNQPGASNQVGMTVNGLVGQTNNLVEWGTNGVRRGRIEAAGHLISDGYLASTNGLINTNIAGHFWRTENLGNGFTWNLDFDGSTIMSVNNAANINASSISMNGSTLSDSSKNITALTGNFKGGILCSNITITNVINLASLSNLTYTNALCATIWNSNNVGIWVRSTNNTDKLLLAIP